MSQIIEDPRQMDSDRLLAALEALANPHRLRILARLHEHGRAYVSQLARDLGLSRPLLHMHLKRLERAGLVLSELELSPEGKALNWFTAAPFDIRLSPERIAHARARQGDSATDPTTSSQR